MNSKDAWPFKMRFGAATSVLAITLFCLAPSTTFGAVEKVPGQTPSGDVSALVSKAQQAMKEGHPDIAVIYLKNAESAAPQTASIHLDLGQALLAVGNSAAAERELNMAAQGGIPAARVLPLIYQAMLSQKEAQLLLTKYAAPNPTDHSPLAADTLRARAFAQSQLGAKTDAAASLEQALMIARSPQNLTARAQLAIDVNDLNLGGKLLDEALGKEATNASALMLRISLFQRTNQADKALALANNFVKSSNSGLVSLITRAGVYLQMKQDQKALPDINAALAVAPNLPQANFLKAVILARAHDTKGAWAIAQTLPRAYLMSRPDVGLAVSQIANDANQRETGTDILHSTVQNYPNDVEARIRLAATYLSLNQSANALQTLQPIETSADPRAMALLAQIYAKQKNYDQSLQYYEKASAAGFGGDALKLQLAESNLQKGNLSQAQQAFADMNAKEPGKPEAAGPLVAIFLQRGDLDSAAKIADSLANAAPKSPYGPLFQGQIFARRGNLDEAIKSFSAALSRDPKFVPALYDRAIMLGSKGELAASQKDLQSILAFDPKNVTASIRLAQLYSQMGQANKAASLLENAVKQNPKSYQATFALAQLYLSQKRGKDANTIVSTFVKVSPLDRNGLVLQANVQLANGAADDAIKSLTNLANQNPKSPEIAVALAQAHDKKKEYGAAKAAFMKALAIDPKNPNTQLALVQHDLAAKDDNAALGDARNFYAKEASPASAQLLASLQVRAKRPADAEKTLRDNLAKAPDGHTLIQLVTVLRDGGKFAAADEVSNSWIAKHPKDADVRLSYGMSLLTRDKARAEQQFRAILAIQPYNLSALNDLAWLLTDKDPKSALDFATRALKLAPQMPSVLDTVGWIKWKMGDRVGATDLIKRANHGAPNDPSIGYHLAVILNASNQSEAAKAILKGVLQNTAAFEDRKNAELLASRLH